MKKRTLIILSGLLLLILVLVIALYTINNNGRNIASDEADREFTEELHVIAEDTFKYFLDFTNPETGLTYDIIRLRDGDIREKGRHTSPTNIGMYFLSVVSADRMELITRQDAVSKIQKTLATLEELKKWNGLFYNWYYTDGSLKTDWGQFISFVDNGWLAAGLIVAGQAYEELSEQTAEIVEAMDFSRLFDPKVGQFHGGYDVVKGELMPWHYGMFYTEPRVASYIAIGKGDVNSDHWWKMYRTLPADWDWQSQIPEGEYVRYGNTMVFQGHYDYLGISFVPSWGGSMFEALMPGLVLKEKELGIKALGINNQRHVDLQIKFADQKGYPAWGFSPAATPDGYSEFGVAALGASGYEDRATITAHATFLALEYAPTQVRKNIKALKELQTYGQYGFYDTVNMLTGRVTEAYLALNQGMIMGSIANYLFDGVIRRYFHDSDIGKAHEWLLEQEEFLLPFP
jgi:hypothetical protein